MITPNYAWILHFNGIVAMDIAAVADVEILEFEKTMQNFKSFGLTGMPEISAKRKALVEVLREKVNPILRAKELPEVDYGCELRLRSFSREYVVGTVNFPRMHLRDFWDRQVRAGLINQLYYRVENKVLYSDLEQRHT